MTDDRQQSSIKSSNHDGFTIVELLIATAVLSIILLISTVLISNIGNLYYKGVNEARTQDDTRAIVDEVTQHLELSQQAPTTSAPTTPGYGTVAAYCTDNTRYTYVTGPKIGNPYPLGSSGRPFLHILWRDKFPSGNACLPADLTSPTPSNHHGGTDGVELIGPNSRLTSFCIAGLSATPANPCTSAGGSPYTISVGVAFGDDDLLNLNGLASTCKGNVGDRFCATASLTTTAAQRVQGN